MAGRDGAPPWTDGGAWLAVMGYNWPVMQAWLAASPQDWPVTERCASNPTGTHLAQDGVHAAYIPASVWPLVVARLTEENLMLGQIPGAQIDGLPVLLITSGPLADPLAHL